MLGKDYHAAAILAARKIIKKYKQLNQNGLIYPLKLTTVREHGWAEPSKHKGLLAAAARITEKPFTAHEFTSRPDDVIAAMMVHYKDHSKIFVNDSSNFCYQRFLVGKELCNIIMGRDNKETQTSEPDSVITLLSDLVNVSLPGNQTPAYEADDAAYFGAMELLMPHEFQVIADEMMAEGKTNLDVAYKVMAPESMVEYRYSQPIREYFNSVYSSHAYKVCDLNP